MQNPFEQFRREVKADFLILHSLYSDLNHRFGHEQNSREELANLFGQTQEHFGELRASVTALQHNVTAMQSNVIAIGSNVAALRQAALNDVKEREGTQELLRRVAGQTRLQAERFDAILGLMSGEFDSKDKFDDIERRLQALERKQAS